MVEEKEEEKRFYLADYFYLNKYDLKEEIIATLDRWWLPYTFTLRIANKIINRIDRLQDHRELLHEKIKDIENFDEKWKIIQEHEKEWYCDN